ncbi:hypothetical protein WA158_001606 [Blastocystis sp. Blastoise]
MNSMKDQLKNRLTYKQLKVFVIGAKNQQKQIALNAVSTLEVHKLSLEYIDARGRYIHMRLYGDQARIYYKQTDKEISPQDVLEYGYYLGTVQVKEDFYVSVSIPLMRTEKKYMQFVAYSEIYESSFAYIRIPDELAVCQETTLTKVDIEDEMNSCIRIKYNLVGEGDIYGHYRLLEDSAPPDEVNVVEEGIYLGKFSNEQVTALYCGLYDDNLYEISIVAKTGMCITKPVYFTYKTNKLSEEAKWGPSALKHIQPHHSTHIGINYRSFGGVEVMANLPEDRVTSNGVYIPVEAEVTSEQQPVDEETLECNPEVKDYNIRFRTAQKKKGKVVIKMMLQGKGHLFVYWTNENKKNVDNSVIVTKGKDLGLYSDDFIFVRLSHLPEKAVNVHFSVQCKNIIAGPFSKLVS